eukprot:16732_1
MGNTAEATTSPEEKQNYPLNNNKNNNMASSGYSTISQNSSTAYRPYQQQQHQQQHQQYQPQQPSHPTQLAASTGDGGGSGDVIDFGNRVVIAYNFWKESVDSHERSKQQQLGVLLFANLFKKQPLCRNLFADSDIQKQSLRLLDMFGWLLRSLVKEKNKMRVRTLKSLGDRHVKYGIKAEYFGPMLDSLSDALQETYDQQYTSQTRVALKSLFQSACNEMMKQAGQKPPFVRTEMDLQQQQQQPNQNNNNNGSVSYRWLRSLDHCLADPMGLSALEQFLKKTYCSELTEFH